MKKILIAIVTILLSVSINAKPGDPLKCAEAKCTNQSGKSYIGTCDASGIFKFDNLPDGQYKANIAVTLADGKTKQNLEFSFDVKAPRDAASGQASGKRDAASGQATGKREHGSGMATGKRQHEPIVIRKDWGKMMLNCTVTNGNAVGSIIEK